MNYDLTPAAKKALQQRIIDHDAEQRRQQHMQQMRDRENADTRAKYLAKLEDEKAEKRKLADIEIDAELEPRKQVLNREWLANHPGKTSIDFEKIAWPHLRANLIVERDELARQAAIAEARERGRFAL